MRAPAAGAGSWVISLPLPSARLTARRKWRRRRGRRRESDPSRRGSRYQQSAVHHFTQSLTAPKRPPPPKRPVSRNPPPLPPTANPDARHLLGADASATVRRLRVSRLPEGGVVGAGGSCSTSHTSAAGRAGGKGNGSPWALRSRQWEARIRCRVPRVAAGGVSPPTDCVRQERGRGKSVAGDGPTQSIKA